MKTKEIEQEKITNSFVKMRNSDLNHQFDYRDRDYFQAGYDMGLQHSHPTKEQIKPILRRFGYTLKVIIDHYHKTWKGEWEMDKVIDDFMKDELLSLIPEKEQPTDEEIKEWVDIEHPNMDIADDDWDIGFKLGLKEGAKAALNGEIKHKT